jgi:hypothetical protein
MKQVLLFCLLTGLFITSASGGEFQVNTHTTWDQADPDIAVDANCGFVVVWRSYGQDGSSNGIFGQRFDPNHSPIGEEFQVNSNITGNQTEPAVATGTAAGFIVTWQGPGITDPNREDIFARWFDPNGLPTSDDIQVNKDTPGRHICPKVAINHSGESIIIWESVDYPEEGDRTICGRLFDSIGMELGDEVVISGEMSPCRYPDVAMDPNGNYVVVWMVDKSSNSIMAGLFNADGSAKTEPFKVDTAAFKSVTQPSVAMDETGCFIVTWDGDPNLASLDDIHARMFDPNGMALSEQFIVNATTEQAQQNPKAAMNGSGEFVIVWEGRIDPNVNARDIFCQRFDGSGQPIGSEFRLNTTMAGDQRSPAVAIGPDGRFVTVWQSDEQDGSGFGIFGRSDFILEPENPINDVIIDE